jgi:hypothetical protein
VSLERQGRADPIIDLMNEFALSSLHKDKDASCSMTFYSLKISSSH